MKRIEDDGKYFDIFIWVIPSVNGLSNQRGIINLILHLIMIGSQVNLNWDDSSSKLLESLKEVWADVGFSDVTLVFEDQQKIEANRTFLAAISPVFKDILKTKCSQNPFFFLFGMDFRMVKYLLDFVYTGEISIAKDSLDAFLTTANRIKLKGFTYTETGSKSIQKDHENDGPTEEELFEENAAIFSLDEEYDANGDCNDVSLSLIDKPENDESKKIESVPHKLEDSKKDVDEEIRRRMLNYGYQWNYSKPDFAKLREEAGPGIHCIVCERAEKFSSFKTIEELYEHEKVTHKRPNKEMYKCESCDEEFHRILLLNQHKRKAHSTTANSSNSNCCDICGKSFKTEKQRNKHRDYSHPVPGKTFKCKLCEKESLTKNASNVHYYQAHTEAERKAFEGKV